METQVSLLWFQKMLWFLPYLWGMETRWYEMPMPTKVSSYRTYEEWKQYKICHHLSPSSWFLPYLWGMETRKNVAKDDEKDGFLPYLWGMETTGLLQNTLSTLSSYRTYEEWKPKIKGIDISKGARSYRTYEEWKLCIHCLNHINYEGSYRTYEEWKRIITDAEGRTFQSSYRTYEEWKQARNPISLPPHPVLTVPMRNGNWTTQWKGRHLHFRSYRTYEEWKLNLFIALSQAFWKFLPYLWGMETSGTMNNLPTISQRSYRTYEEWKLFDFFASF